MQTMLQNFVHASMHSGTGTQALFFLSLPCSKCQASGITKIHSLTLEFPFSKGTHRVISYVQAFPKAFACLFQGSCFCLMPLPFPRFFTFTFSKESAAMLAAKFFFQVFGFLLGDGLLFQGCPDVINDL